MLDNQTVEGQNTQQIIRRLIKLIISNVFYTFLRELKVFTICHFWNFNKSFQLTKEQDSSSPAITIPTGLPFDNSVTDTSLCEVKLPIRALAIVSPYVEVA